MGGEMQAKVGEAPSLSISCMHGGSEGEHLHGYAHNSLVQNFTFHTYATPHLSGALLHLLHLFIPKHFQGPLRNSAPHVDADEAAATHPATSSNETAASTRDTHAVTCHHSQPARLVICDFGCAHGPNTLAHAQFVVQVLLHHLKSSRHIMSLHPHHARSQMPKQTILEIQYFFSDLPQNNFNSLLQSLDSFWDKLVEDSAPFNVEMFDAVVAGSFHKRLFPTRSLDIAISIFGLHWLSQVPQEVEDKTSPSWNGGHVWLHGQRPLVVEAYTRQFKKDLRSFLCNRAEELVSGGMLFLFCIARVEKNPEGAFLTPYHDIWTGFFESTWKEMVSDGLIEEKEMDMFNIPLYNCHLSDMQEILQEFTSVFTVLKMEVMKGCKNLPQHVEKELEVDPKVFGEYWSRVLASLTRPLVQQYIGPSRAEIFFEKLKYQATMKAHLSTCMAYDMLIAIIQRI